MRIPDIARRAARSLRNAKTRTILTSLAIAVGAFTITISIAAGEGARQYADRLIGSNINPQMLFVVKDKTLFEGGAAAQAGLRVYDEDAGMTATGLTIKQMTQKDIDKIAERDDVETIVPIYNPQIRFVQFDGSKKKFTGDVTSYDATITNNVAAGELPPLGTQLKIDEVAMPKSFADVLIEEGVIEKAEDLIGTQVTMTVAQASAQPSLQEIQAAFMSGGEKAVARLTTPKTKEITLKVVALTSQAVTALSGTTAFQVSADQARAIAEFTTKGTDNYQKYLGVTVLAKEGVVPTDLKAALDADGYAAQTAKDLQGVIFTIVNILQNIVLGFGIVALIASVFGIINTQYISVLERTREIGLMKALGARGLHVSLLFQFEAAWIGFLGGIIGAAIAAGLGSLLNPWITETLELGEGNYILIFQFVPIVIMILALMIIAMLAGFFPARKAAKLDPIEALRTE